MITVKRVYDEIAEDDGYRILVDRLWPRGLSKEKARVDLWLRDIAPSDELRKWFAHETEKWDEFKRKYHAELAGKKSLTDAIREKARTQNITLLFGAKNEKTNNAVALKEYLENL